MLLVWFSPDRAPGTDFEWLGPDAQPIRELTVRLMPFVILICLTAAIGGALNVRGHYTTPALGPVALNVVWIATLGLIGIFMASDLSDDPGRHMMMVRWLAWGVLGAGVVQLVVMLPALGRYGLLGAGAARAGRNKADRRAAWGVLKRSAPLAVGAAVYQINVMIDGFMAEGLLPDGGPTVHYLANRVQQFPLALVAIAATTAVFPALTALGQERRLTDLRRLHDATQRNVIFVALPAVAGLLVLATPIVSVLFEYGAFGETGVERTAAALRVLALAIIPAGAVGLVARTYYSMGDFKTPVRISSLMLGCNVLLNYAFIRGLGMDADGLALATTMTISANLILLLPGLRTKLGLPGSSSGWARSSVRMALAASLCGVGAWAGWRWLAEPLGGILALATSIVFGAALYVAGSELFGVPEWESLRSRLLRNTSKIPPK
jgi:putative peptidoglycan lipid II flippase